MLQFGRGRRKMREVSEAPFSLSLFSFSLTRLFPLLFPFALLRFSYFAFVFSSLSCPAVPPPPPAPLALLVIQTDCWHPGRNLITAILPAPLSLPLSLTSLAPLRGASRFLGQQ